jgi:hypothetical protein
MGRIGLAVVLIGLFIAPLVAEAQPAGKVATVGILAIEALPPIDSFRQRVRELASRARSLCPGSRIERVRRRTLTDIGTSD